MDFQTSPFFGIILSIIAFEVGFALNKKFKLSVLNPILIAAILIISFLLIAKIPLEDYQRGGDLISLFLGPVTVVLAVPLYKQLENLKKHFVPVILGIFVGSSTAIFSVIFAAKILDLSDKIFLSFVPKSITIPMGVEVSKQIGGVPAVTIIAITITGITGAVLSPFICRLFRVKNALAAGVAIGTTSHALGTSKAMEMGEVQGAFASLSIGIAGVITAIFAPLFLTICG